MDCCRKGYKSEKRPKWRLPTTAAKSHLENLIFFPLRRRREIPTTNLHPRTRPLCVCLTHYTRCQRCSRALADVSIFYVALVTGEKSNFQFILRLLNTNVDGKQKVMYALTKIKGVGRRYSNLVCKKADVDLNKRYVKILHFIPWNMRR